MISGKRQDYTVQARVREFLAETVNDPRAQPGVIATASNCTRGPADARAAQWNAETAKHCHAPRPTPVWDC